MSKVPPEVQHMYYKKHYEKNKFAFQKKTYINSWLKNGTFPNQGMIEKYQLTKEDLHLLIMNINEKYNIPTAKDILHYESDITKYEVKEDTFVFTIIEQYCNGTNEVDKTFDDMKKNIIEKIDKELLLNTYINFTKMKNLFEIYINTYPEVISKNYNNEDTTGLYDLIQQCKQIIKYNQVLYDKLLLTLKIEKPIVETGVEDVKEMLNSHVIEDDRFWCLMEAISNNSYCEDIKKIVRKYEIDVMKKINERLYDLRKTDYFTEVKGC